MAQSYNSTEEPEDLSIFTRTTSSSSSGIMDCEEGSVSRSAKSSTSSYSSCCTNLTDEGGNCGQGQGHGAQVWNNFIFKPLQPEDYGKVLSHMRESFYRDEPLNAITGYSEEKAQDMDMMIRHHMRDGLSSIVLEKETNKVAGARIIAVHRRSNPHSPFPKFESQEMQRIMPFLDRVDETAAIFDQYPELDEYAELFMASVHPDFRGQGLAGEMYRGAIRLLQGKGFKLMKSCFTSPFTKRIGEKMGFRELASAKFNEYREEESGELVFPSAKDDEMAVIGVLDI